MIVERIRRLEVRDAVALELALGLADDRNLRIGEDRVRLREPVVDPLVRAGRRVAPGDLSLLNRNVDERIPTRHVADGEDVGVGGAQRVVDRDAGDGMGGDSGAFEVEPLEVRHASQRVEDLVRGDAVFGAVLHVVHDLHPVVAHGDALDPRAGLDADPLFAEVFGEAQPKIVILAREEVAGTNQDRRRYACAMEELAELAADVAAPQDDQRFRRRVEVERFVAVDEACVDESRDDGRRRDASGGEHKARGVEHLVTDPQGRRRLEPGGTVEHRKRFDPRDPIVGPAAHQLALPRGKRAVVEPRGLDVDRQLARRANVVQQVGRSQQGLGGHAPAQDAQAAERAAVDKRHAGAQVASRPGRGV